MGAPNVCTRLLATATCLLALAVALVSRNASGQESASTTALDDSMASYRVYKAATMSSEREVAQYRLAVSLYRAKLHQAAFGVFSEIADHPNHIELHATLPWLAKLATDLPEPADVEERVGKYDEVAIDQLQGQQRELYWQLSYLLGRYRYRNGQYEDALRLFAKLDRQSPFYCKAQFLGGLANVQLRRPIDAVQSFERIVAAIDGGSADGLEDKQRMRDLALLSIARTYYSASVRIDSRGAPAIHRVRLAAAVKSWNAVDVGGEYWQVARFEQAWAYFVMGDHARALGNIHMIQSAFSQNAYDPEVDILRSTVYVANCQYDDAATLAARFHVKYQPIATELSRVLTTFDGTDQDERLYRFATSVREGKANVSAQLTSVVAEALADRQFLRHLQYVVVLEDEQKRFAQTPAAFRDSPLGNDVKDALQLARDIAVRNAAELVRARCGRALAELEEHLRDNVRLLVGAMAGRSGELDPHFVPLRVPGRDAGRNVVRPDEEHVIWPFSGEYWRDEAGSYRQSIRSKCR